MGLVRFGWRDYDPEVGRFTAPDPAKDRRGDGDLYDYCVDDPVSYLDRMGLKFSHAAAVAGGESHKGISHPFGAKHGEGGAEDWMRAPSERAMREQMAKGTLVAAAGNATLPATRNGTAPATQNATEKNTQSDKLGVRINNPLNVRPVGSKDPWQGQVGVHTSKKDKQGFSEFDTLGNGLRAGAINIISQQALHGKNTVREIVERLTPDKENNTEKYIRDLAAAMGVNPDERIDTMDKATLTKFMNAAIILEVGQSYPPKQIEKAVDTAIAHHESKKKK